MNKDSKEIREIMTDIKDIMSKPKMNESYILGKPQEKLPEDVEPEDAEPEIPEETPEIENDVNVTSNVDGKIKEIRKTAILLIAELDPETDSAYKVIKNIWDSCDKYLSKDKEPTKEINNN